MQGKRALDEAKYLEITSWYLDLLAAVYLVCWPEIEKVLGAGEAHMLVTYSSRIKTEDTIVEKLARQGTRLDRVQDFADARFDIDCRLSELQRMAHQIRDVLEAQEISVKVKEYLEDTQQGYRAIHLHITSSTAGRVELQLRTALQAAWANTYEVLADVAGRGIRYDSGFSTGDETFDQLARDLREISDALYSLEKSLDDRHLETDQEPTRRKKRLIELLEQLAADIVDRGRRAP